MNVGTFEDSDDDKEESVPLEEIKRQEIEYIKSLPLLEEVYAQEIKERDEIGNKNIIGPTILTRYDLNGRIIYLFGERHHSYKIQNTEYRVPFFLKRLVEKDLHISLICLNAKLYKIKFYIT
jgi:hypothetical protein